MARRSPLRYTEYLLARGVYAVTARVPLVCSYVFLEGLSLFLATVSKYRRRTRENLDLAWGDERSPAWKRRIFRECHRQLAWYIVDVFLAPRLLTRRRYLDTVDLSQVEEVFRRDGIGETSGALLVGSHQGAPEIASLALAAAGRPNAAFVRPPQNPYMGEFTRRQRESFPRATLDHRGSLREAWRRVAKNKEIVGLQIDQDAGERGVFVPYFGIPASTTTGPAELALTTKAPVYFISCLRTRRRRFGLEVRLTGPFTIEETGDRTEDVRRLTEVLTAEVEAHARACPEQVMWGHRRWKTRPPLEEGEPLAVDRRRTAQTIGALVASAPTPASRAPSPR